MIGTTELLLIGAIILLLFGGKKLPELMKGIGQGVRSFKQGMNEPTKEEKAAASDNEVKLPEEESKQ
ncbi:MAG: twin-arginine translocase TatA/TatE family subunit [Muribaculaceae bacterium]